MIRQNKEPFVLGRGWQAVSSTLVFDFYMFLQLLLYYTLCILFGSLAVLLDTITNSKRFSNALANFFYYIANL